MKSVLLLVVSVGVTAVAAPVTAQTRPYRGLFGAPPNPDSPHSLVFIASAFAAYDDNVTEALRSEVGLKTPWLLKSGTYQGAGAGLRYTFSLHGERADFSGTAGGQISYYHHEERSAAQPASQADLSLGVRLTRTLSFVARQTLAYATNYNGMLVPALDDDLGDEIGAEVNPLYDLFEMRTLRSVTKLGLAQRFGRYAYLSGAYHVRTSIALDDQPEGSPFADYTTHTGTGAFTYARPMSANATLLLGYGIRVTRGRLRTGEPEIMHNINAGVDYSRALSFSRRTFLRFGTGSAIVVGEEVSEPGTDPHPRVLLTGQATLVHQIGRTWTADLGYTRGFRTRDGFDQLYFTDAVYAGIGGLLSRRVSVSAGATWANSTVGDHAQGHNGVSASAQATYGFSRFLGLYASYVYYHYRFDETVPLDEHFPQRLDRQGIRVGLTTSIPLIK
jgi:hypothetical protein